MSKTCRLYVVDLVFPPSFGMLGPPSPSKVAAKRPAELGGGTTAVPMSGDDSGDQYNNEQNLASMSA